MQPLRGQQKDVIQRGIGSSIAGLAFQTLKQSLQRVSRPSVVTRQQILLVPSCQMMAGSKRIDVRPQSLAKLANQ
jgi:hypothetical protein